MQQNNSEEVIRLYQAGVTVEAIAEQLKLSTRSVIARLCAAKVYKAAKYQPKYGASRPYSKLELVELIEALCNKPYSSFAGLETAPKQVLITLVTKLGGKLE